MLKKIIIKKIFLNLLLLIIPLYLINSQVKITLPYKDLNDSNKTIYYVLEPIDNKSIEISPFDPLLEIDETFKHKFLLSSLEKSRLTSLFYVGDKYEFNNIEIMLKYNGIYQIMEKSSGFSVLFSLGYYDNVILHSAINFHDKEFNIIDKLASSLAVKQLLKRMTGKTLKAKKDIIENNKLQDSNILNAYQNFIDKLKKLNNKEKIFTQLKNYVNLNFRLTGKTKITSDWIHPAYIYFNKEGDYKSIAFFYYYTLKELGFNARSYLIAELIKKEKKELDDLYDLVSKKNKNNKDLIMMQKIELEYKNVNTLKYLSAQSKYAKPSRIFFYKPPNFESSIFLTAVEINNKWIYTTGDIWIDEGIYTPDRTCANYSRNGCYYANVNNQENIFLNNLPFSEKDILWDVFYNTK